MPLPTAEAALCELITRVRQSFPQYLQYAHPYVRRGIDDLSAVLNDIVADQNVLANRATAMLDNLGRVAPNTEFPMEFTDSNDLAIDYLIDRAIRRQQNDIATLANLSDSLSRNQSIRSLVDEARGMAQAHLELLEECPMRR